MPQPRNDSNAPDFGLLVNRAAIEIIKPERGSGRDRLAPPAQRLHDMFRVLHARRRGVTDLEAIAAEADLGVQGSTWMEAITSGHREPDELVPLRRPSLDFAWLLGLYAAIRRSPAGGSPRPLRVRLDEDETRDVSDRMNRLFGRRPTVRRVDGQCDVFFGNQELSKLLHDVTQGNTVVPWEHLVTPEERVAFLTSFLRRRSSLAATGGVRPILAINKRMAPSLRNDLLLLFAQLGVFPNFGRSRIFFQTLPDLRQVLALGLLEDDERRDHLRELVESAPFSSLDTDVDLYYRVLAGERTDEVSAETQRRWTLDEYPPKVKRLRKIAAVLADGVDPDLVGYLFRGLNFSAEESREIASRHSLRRILELCERLRGSRIPESGWAEWLSMSETEIEQRLGGEDSISIFVKGREFRLTPRARMRYLQAYGLQPGEFEDFSICLDHIQSELEDALEGGEAGSKLESSSLVFSMQGEAIQSIRLVTCG